MLTPDIVEAFKRDGYVVVPDLLSAAEIESFEAIVTGAVRRRQRGHRDRAVGRAEPLPAVVHPVHEPLGGRRRCRAGSTFHQRIGQAAAELLEVDAIRLWHDQALYKEAGGRETDPHQDHPYWPIAETASVTAWIPFVGSTLASGAMGYLPGSHLIGMRKFVNIFFGEPDDILADPEISGIEPVFVEVPAGSVAFHHGLTVHLAEAEHDRPRPGGAHDHLLPRRQHSRLPVPALQRRSRLDRGRRGHRQRRDADRVAAPGGCADPAVACRAAPDRRPHRRLEDHRAVGAAADFGLSGHPWGSAGGGTRTLTDRSTGT